MVTKTASAGVTNWARFSDPEVDELHFKYRNSSDQPARSEPTLAQRAIADDPGIDAALVARFPTPAARDEDGSTGRQHEL